MSRKNRNLHLLRYLYRETDEDHPATTDMLLNALSDEGIEINRHTLADDVAQLESFGADIVLLKGAPNRYFIGQRCFELPELKLLVDAVESSRFISAEKSLALTKKLCGLASVHQAQALERHLYVDGRVKSNCKTLYYTVDLLHRAINTGLRVRFRYIEYTVEKKKCFKHGGYIYELSPYALLWHNDCYYVLGHSEKHRKIAKFRVDRIANPELTDVPVRSKPENFDPVIFLKRCISMYDGQEQSVHLRCAPEMMKVLIDRFGEDIRTKPNADGSFTAELRAAVSPTFFGWVFSFAGKIRIEAPTQLVEEYRKLASAACAE